MKRIVKRMFENHFEWKIDKKNQSERFIVQNRITRQGLSWERTGDWSAVMSIALFQIILVISWCFPFCMPLLQSDGALYNICLPEFGI